MATLNPSRTLLRSLERTLVRRAPNTTRPLSSLPRHVTTPRSPHLTTPAHRFLATTSTLRKEASPPSPSGISPPKPYSYIDVESLSTSPSPSRILIDVREPSELLATGRIPTAKSVPLSSSPDAFFLSPEDFEDKFGFARPGEDHEVIFYCKSGVRSRQAALLAGQARPKFGGALGNYAGSWLDWVGNGGKVEKEGDQEGSAVSGVTDAGQGRP